MRTLLLMLAALWMAVAVTAPATAAPGAGILILGDSNSEGPFGGTLYDTLRGLHDPVTGTSVAVTIFAKCGAGANDWVEREYSNIDCGAWTCSGNQSLQDCHHFKGGNIPPLRRFYADLEAPRRVTLVVLGLNMIIGNRAQKLRDAVALIDAIHEQHSACIWIGPPQAGDLFVSVDRFESFIADLKQTVTAHNCRYIASDDKTDRRNVSRKDDHYSRPDAIAWANKVLYELSHPANHGDKPLLTLLSAPEQ
ncbi:MAG TPA: hypothetical protein VHZ29_01695 [Rhizomicrobium sp.]|nr:hypothetical protein [Rhizomicrobium sp.]